MSVKGKKTLLLILFILLVSVCFRVFSISRQKKEKSAFLQLKEALKDALKEKEKFVSYSEKQEKEITALRSSLQGMEMRLRGLDDIQGLKNALISAQSTIDQLNKEVKQLSDENVALRSGSTDLSCFKNAVKDSTLAKEKFESINKKIQPSKNNIVSVVSLEKRIKDLERERDLLQLQTLDFQKTVSSQSNSLRSLQDNISELNVTLGQKESQVKFLREELAKLNSLKVIQEGKIDQQSKRISDEKKKMEEKLAQAQAESVKSNVLKKEIVAQAERFEELNVLYKEANSQLTDMISGLTQKEMELEEKRKEVASLKDEIFFLKERAENLEKELTEAKKQQKQTLDDLSTAIKLNTELLSKSMGITEDTTVLKTEK